MVDRRVVSVNVGRATEWEWRGRRVRTAFLKSGIPGRVALGVTGLAGDETGDPSVHGGPSQAVYAYPSEHYEFWRSEVSDPSLPWGSFGENLTTAGISESEVAPGDRLEIGDAELTVVRPRFPCFKLNVRFRSDRMLDTFARAGRPGFYLSVARTGTVASGDAIRVRWGPRPAASILELFLPAPATP